MDDVKEPWLWDRSGPPDPAVEKLESLLAPYRWRGRTEAAPPGRDQAAIIPRRREAAIIDCHPASGPWTLRRVAAAALFLAAIGAGIAWLSIAGGDDPTPVSPALGGSFVAGLDLPTYEVTLLAGAATLFAAGAKSGVRLSGGGRPVALPVGGTVATEGEGSVEIQAPRIGRVTLGDSAVLRLDSLAADLHRFHLDRGRMRASILPPGSGVKPRLFQVGTPAGVAVDLGCIYEILVDGDGKTSVEVTFGCVVFEVEDGEVWVTSGHRMRAERGKPLGLPVANVASDGVRAAARAFDEAPGDGARRAALQDLLARSETSEKLTLWNLLRRVDRPERKDVFDRLVSLHPLPKGLDPERVLDLDPEALTELRLAFSPW